MGNTPRAFYCASKFGNCLEKAEPAVLLYMEYFFIWEKNPCKIWLFKLEYLTVILLKWSKMDKLLLGKQLISSIFFFNNYNI